MRACKCVFVCVTCVSVCVTCASVHVDICVVSTLFATACLSVLCGMCARVWECTHARVYQWASACYQQPLVVRSLLPEAHVSHPFRHGILELLHQVLHWSFFSICLSRISVSCKCFTCHLSSANRSHHPTDEATILERASSKSIPEGQRAFVLAAVRHQKSSPLSPAQEKKKRNPTSMARRTQARQRATDCISQVSSHRETCRTSFTNLMSQAGRKQARHRMTEALHWKDYHWMSKRELNIAVPKHRDPECSLRGKKVTT